ALVSWWLNSPMDDIFTITRAQNPLPLGFDSPHSGTRWPADFTPACPPEALRRDEDLYVDDLFSAAPQHGGVLLAANFPRYYVDVNRAEDDIDTSLFEGEYTHGPANPTTRSDAGIGMIWRLAKPGVPIYETPLGTADIARRIEH